jgi:hypothetical protein
MRVVAKQNIWTDGRAYVVGEAFELSDALAQQLACDGLVELAPVQAEPVQAEPVQAEKPKRSRKK